MEDEITSRTLIPTGTYYTTSGRERSLLPTMTKSSQEVEFVTTINGKLHCLYEGYSYYMKHERKQGRMWYCTHGCKAHLVLTIDGKLLTKVHEHTHPNKKFRKIDIQLITLCNGKQRFLYKGYTFYMKRKFKNDCWRCCCTGKANCKAYITVSSDGSLVHAFNVHEHPPQKYVRTHNGTYVKVSHRVQ
ncbi:hypothetical protein ACJJTC_012607 [Scirpophaga incertulas]